ncbi:Bacterial type II secretion system protein F domain protein [compost metagenome]
MLLILLITLLALGLYGLLSGMSKKKQLSEKLLLLDDFTMTREKIDDNQDTVEGIFNKSSRFFQIASLLDKNIGMKFIIMCSIALVIVVICSFTHTELTQQMLLIIGLADVIAVIMLPGMVKGYLVNVRIKAINDDLPLMIDIMAMCIQSGMTVEKSLSHIAININAINQDMSVMLQRVVAMSEVSGIAGALDEMSLKIPGQEMRLFCTTLQQSVKFGSSVYQVLIELSGEIRSMQLLATEEKVASLSAKMTMPMILFIMFPLLLIVAGPGFIGMMSTWSN